MELTRWLQGVKDDMTTAEWERAARTTTLLLAPFHPYMAEELWERLGGHYSVHFQAWPEFDASALVQDEVTLVVQVNGKVRGRVTVPAGLSEQQAQEIAVAEPNVARYLDGGSLRHVVFVPDKLINLVL
jgi:leucyl-tRNA synthetase